MHPVQLRSILAPFLFATPITFLASVLFKIIVGTTVAATPSVKLQMDILMVSGESTLYFQKAAWACWTQTGILSYVPFLRIRKPLLNYNLLLSIQGQSFHINIGITLLCDYLSVSSLLDSNLHNEKKLLFLFTLGSLKYLNFACHMIIWISEWI